MGYLDLIVDEETRGHWIDFSLNQSNFGHANRDNYIKNFDVEFKDSCESAFQSVKRIDHNTNSYKPLRILEIGCSTGLNCFALAKFYPGATVYGIEPETEALDVARAISKKNNYSHVHFLNGVGEELPFENDFFDLIVCHTVIEHVNNVDAVIGEMSRVLSGKGFIHFECPNYNWPYEPHLAIWCIPRFGKNFTSICAIVQGQRNKVFFLKHLKFVYPKFLEKIFQKNNLKYKNITIEKLERILSGDMAGVYKYKLISRIVYFLGLLGLHKALRWVFIKTSLYPSVFYLIRK